MEELFVPYEESLALKELGFDEQCLGFYRDKTLFPVSQKSTRTWRIMRNISLRSEAKCSAPLYQQAFKWFREKYHWYVYPEYVLTGDSKGIRFHIINSAHKTILSKWCDTYEEAELECLRKLIEIVKSKN